MKRKIAVVVLAAIAVVSLASCASFGGTPEKPGNTHDVGWYDSGDGRTVWCIKHSNGISCDWENAKTGKIVEVAPDANE